MHPVPRVLHLVPDVLQVRRVFRIRSRLLSSGRACGTISAAVSVNEHLFGLHISGPEWDPAAVEHLFDTHRLWLAYANICSDRPSAPTRSHRPSVGIGSGIGFPDRPSAADRFGSGSAAL